MTHKPITHAAAAVALFAAAAAAQADLLSPPDETIWSDRSAAIAASTAASWAAPMQPSGPSGTAFALTSNSALADVSRLASSASTGSLSLPSNSAASLWIFVTSVRAQQRSDTFSVLETHLSLVQLADALPPSQVPLPAAAWCLLMGLLGMAGVRLTGQGKQRMPREQDSGRESPAAGPQPLPA